MSKWKYTLKRGKALREAVEGVDLIEVLDELYMCYEELFEADIIDQDDHDRYIDDLLETTENVEEILEYSDDYEDDDYLDDEDAQDEVDWQLTEFYDLCDNIGVWIPL